MDDWQAILRSEFDAEEGSFLLKMRCELAWDVDVFERVSSAMASCCRAKEGDGLIERWISEGFWYYSWAVKDWTTHPNFPRYHVAEYYQAAYEYLNDLAFWFFVGESPWTDGGEQSRSELQRLSGLNVS
jgi:hypothetical protein